MSLTSRTLLVAGLCLAATTLAIAQTVGTDAKPAPAPALWVNDQPVSSAQLERVKRSNPVLGLQFTGVVGQDLQNLLWSETVDAALLRQDSASIEVDPAKVEAYIAAFREREKLVRDEDFQVRLGQLGLSDAGLHEVVREAFGLEARTQAVRAQASVSKAELEFYVKLNAERLQTQSLLEDRVLARQIVLQDAQLAKDLIRKAKAGQDFAALAREFSSSGALRGGAINNDGSAYPGWVTRAAFPTKVAEAVFKLGTKAGAGIVGPVRDGTNLYVVRVAQFLPAVRTLGVLPALKRAQLEAQALPLKQDQALEQWLDALRTAATVRFAEGNEETYFNPSVASVGAEDVLLSDLNRLVYTDPQVVALLLGGANSTNDLVPQFFKQRALQALLDQRVASLSAKRDALAVFGPRNEQLEMVLRWQTREVRASSSEARDYYDGHLGEFITPASALMLEASFKTQGAATAFREALIKSKGENFRGLASEAAGVVRDLGRVTSATLAEEYQGLLGGDSKRLSSKRRVSKVIARAGWQRVLLVSEAKAAVVPRYSKVRDLALQKASVLKQAESARRWLATQREVFGAQNRLLAVIAELEARAKAAETVPVPEPTSPTPPPAP